MISQQVLKDFEHIFEVSTNKVLLPYQKGNTIRIGDYAVIFAKKQNSYKIQDTMNHCLVAEAFSKSAAIALAVTLANKKTAEREILDLDRVIQKNFMDGVFYRHTIKVTKDETRRASAMTRLDIAQARVRDAKQRVETILFSSLAK